MEFFDSGNDHNDLKICREFLLVKLKTLVLLAYSFDRISRLVKASEIKQFWCQLAQWVVSELEMALG